jgi:hypothetical protein
MFEIAFLEEMMKSLASAVQPPPLYGQFDHEEWLLRAQLAQAEQAKKLNALRPSPRRTLDRDIAIFNYNIDMEKKKNAWEKGVNSTFVTG